MAVWMISTARLKSRGEQNVERPRLAESEQGEGSPLRVSNYEKFRNVFGHLNSSYHPTML